MFTSRRSQSAWLGLLGLILIVRFPIKFLLEPPYLMDFEVFRAVAVRLLSGEATALYQPVGTGQMMFKYAPCWALLMAPLGWVPSHMGLITCAVLTTGWLLLTCWAGLRLCEMAGLRPAAFLPLIAVLLLVRPIASEFLLGQTNLLWGGLATLWWFFDQRNRLWPSAIALALAMSLKVPAAVLWLGLLAQRRWDQTLRTIGAALALNGLASLLIMPSAPIQPLRDWWRVLASSGPDRAFEIGNQSIVALAGRLLRNDGFGLNLLTLPDPTVFLVASLVGLILCTMVLASFASARTPQQALCHVGPLMVLMVVLSPTCWVATYSALLFPILLLLVLVTQQLKTLLRHSGLMVGVVALGLLSLMTHAKFWRLIGLPYFKGESYVYLALMVLPLLGLALLWSLWQVRWLDAEQPQYTSHN